MAQEFSKVKLSGSTNGRGILIAATATPGTLLHTTPATGLDEIWLWFTNTDTTPRKVTLEWGGVAVPDDLREVTVPAESGALLLVPGWVLTGGLSVRAFAAAASVVVADGYVNRITG